VTYCGKLWNSVGYLEDMIQLVMAPREICGISWQAQNLGFVVLVMRKFEDNIKNILEE